MDITHKKEELQKIFNENIDKIQKLNQDIRELSVIQEQIKGQYKLLEEMEEEKEEEKVAKKENTSKTK
jgi:N-glycosylase/DNA lyase